MFKSILANSVRNNRRRRSGKKRRRKAMSPPPPRRLLPLLLPKQRQLHRWRNVSNYGRAVRSLPRILLTRGQMVAPSRISNRNGSMVMENREIGKGTEGRAVAGDSDSFHLSGGLIYPMLLCLHFICHCHYPVYYDVDDIPLPSCNSFYFPSCSKILKKTTKICRANVQIPTSQSVRQFTYSTLRK